MAYTSERWGSLQPEHIETPLTITHVGKPSVEKFAFYKARIITEFPWKYLNTKSQF